MAHASHHRSSSFPRTNPSFPTTPSALTSTPNLATPPSYSSVVGGSNSSNNSNRNPRQASDAKTPPPHPTLLQPRVAVVLNVPPPWHPWLFALRLLSICPALWWGVPTGIEFVLRNVPRGPQVLDALMGAGEGSIVVDAEGKAKEYPATEMALATIWCFASGYLSFFFTDCLMSRWLLKYTPQATIVRLLTMNVLYAYIVIMIISFSGGFEDPRLLLPGWIGIATTLTVCYHISNQKINIRKETSTSVNVFSIASFISMVTLLGHLHAHQPEYPAMPVVEGGKYIWAEALRLAQQAKGNLTALANGTGHLEI